MSILDVSPSLQGVALGPQPGEQARMPATFGEVFSADWNEARLFAQSSAHATAKQQALTDYVDETRKNTGVDLTGAASHIIINSDWDGANQEVARLREKNPGVNLPPFSNDDLESRALAISRQARADADEMSRRERASGGSLGGFFGMLAGGITDPINILALPVAPAEGLPLLSYALRWGAIAAATQGASEALAAPYHEQVQPGYIASGEPLLNIGGAAVSGAALGVGGRVAGTLLGRAWGRVKTGTWSTAVRDAGNLAESEANIVHSNVYPGAAGEAAHRDALASASDQVIKGEPVDVAEHVTPEISAAGEQRLAPIMDARAAAIGADEAARAERAAATGEPAPELPFEATAKQAASEAAVARVADHVQQISEDVPREDAEKLAKMIVKADEPQAQAIVQAIQERPQTVADFPPRVPKEAPEPPATVLPPAEVAKTIGSPEHEAALRADIDRARMTKDVKIPAGVDEKGEPVFRSLDSAMEEVDAFKAAADHIQACANPVQEPTNG